MKCFIVTVYEPDAKANLAYGPFSDYSDAVDWLNKDFVDKIVKPTYHIVELLPTRDVRPEECPLCGDCL